jgi:hypothetical protein
VKVLEQIYAKRTHGIVFLRGGAGKEIVPSSSRNGVQISAGNNQDGPHGGDDTGLKSSFNELREKALYKVKKEIASEDIQPVILPINSRYRLIIYADASFAVGEFK